jgi:hypothetical protein
MTYYARFETVADHMFRFDTRIYLGEHDSHQSGECVGAIIGKNPGSAKPTQFGILAPLELNGDKMLPSVRNRFIAAYEQTGNHIPANAFVQVWNLFYLCNPNLGEACSKISNFASPPQCPSENNEPKVVWFAWGGNDGRLNPFKLRFTSCQRPSFYYNHQSRAVVSHTPSAHDFAKHPQGMPAIPVINYLASVL